VDYKGATNDVRGHINASQVFVLPSHHEGLPRSTLEAMSMGRAILTTDAIGCRETVLEGVNGFMVPVGMPIKLAEKMVFFIENSEITRIMGEESRKIVVNRFDVVKVNKDMLRILGIA